MFGSLSTRFNSSIILAIRWMVTRLSPAVTWSISETLPVQTCKHLLYWLITVRKMVWSPLTTIPMPTSFKFSQIKALSWLSWIPVPSSTTVQTSLVPPSNSRYTAWSSLFLSFSSSLAGPSSPMWKMLRSKNVSLPMQAMSLKHLWPLSLPIQKCRNCWKGKRSGASRPRTRFTG